MEEDVYTLFNGEMGTKNAFLMESVRTTVELEFLNELAISSNTHIGFGFTAVLSTINFILASRGTNVMLMRDLKDWRINLNTFLMAVGPKTCGKSPAVKVFIKDPLKALDESWQNKVFKMSELSLYFR